MSRAGGRAAWSAVLENSPVAIGFVGRDGRLGRLNPAFAQAGASLKREVAVSDSLLDLFPRDRVMLERMLDETLRWVARTTASS